MGLVQDPRAREAVYVLLSLRCDDGTWRPGPPWWRAPGRGSDVEIVDWRETVADERVTLNALRILTAARY
jgi:hypothetical protein